MRTVPNKFHVVTFGCQMNLHDSEHIAGSLAQLGMQGAGKPDDADVIVFNTCCVRAHAEERFYGRLSQLAPVKQANPGLVIAVTGCVAENDREEVFERAPYVDLVVGTRAVGSLAGLVAAQMAGNHARTCVVDPSEAAAADLPARRESRVHGWISIMTGCDNYCSYCIVPHVRGRETSRRMQDVVEEAAAMADEGVLDVTLLGQNVNSYGRDLYGAPRFAELLRHLDRSGIARVRFTTSHPKDLCDETIATIASSSHICRHIHLPVQSGSSAVLKRMNRSYTKQAYLALVGRIRGAMPEVALSTDIMVGFPGETEDDFQDTLDVVRHTQFDQAFTFMFSKRRGTPAAAIEKQIEQDVKHERFSRLVDVVAGGARDANQSYVGQSVEVLVEGPSRKDSAKLSGRTRSNKVVHFEGPQNLRHQFAIVNVTGARTWFLEGILADADPGRPDDADREDTCR